MFDAYRTWRFPLLIGFLCRLLYLLLIPQRPPLGDDAFYWGTAQSIANGAGYVYQGIPATEWMPGFPFLLSIIVFLFGPSLFIARLFLLCFSTATIPLVGMLADRWFDTKTGIFSAWGFALFPPLWFYGTALLSETPTIFFLILILYLASLLQEHFRWRYAFLLGLIYAALIYLKPELVFLGPFYAIVSLIWPKVFPKRATFVMGVLGILSLLPWTYRNHVLFDEFIPLKTTGGKLIWWASHHPPLFTHPKEPALQAQAEKLVVKGKPGKTSQNYMREGFRRISENPIPYLVECVTVRARMLFLGSQTEATEGLSRSFSDLYQAKSYLLLLVKLLLFFLQAGVSIFGILGFFLLKDPEKHRIIAVFHFWGIVTIYMLLLGITRYSMILMPILIPYAAACILFLGTVWKKSPLETIKTASK